MTALTLSTSGAATLRADALVVGLAKGSKGPVLAPGAEAVDKAFGGKLAAVLETLGASGAEGELTKVPAAGGLKAPVVVAVGLGTVPDSDDAYDSETLRRAAGVAARALTGAKKAGFALPAATVEDAAAVAEGALLGAYAFTAYQGGLNKLAPQAARDNAARLPLAEVALLGTKPRDKAFKAAAERAVAVAEEINRARDLINTPPNDLYPESFAAVAPPPARSTASRSRCSTRRRSSRAVTAASSASARAPPAPPPGEARLHAPQGGEDPGPGGQGHHLRLGRHLAQAVATTRR